VDRLSLSGMLGAFQSGMLNKWQTGAFVIQETLEMFAQILDEMIPIRDLSRMRQDLAYR
jgi:hypothetical protein